jgi:hypothetical protein
MKTRNDLIGRRISVAYPRGGNNIVGTCTYAQVNGLHGKFQVTIDRMPVWPVDPKRIKILDNN